MSRAGKSTEHRAEEWQLGAGGGGAEGPQRATAEWGQGLPLGNKIVRNTTVAGVTTP